MAIPVYQYIELKRHTPQSIEKQLSGIDHSEAPIVLDLTQLHEHQLDALKTIEDFFAQNDFPFFPYSVYILSDYKGYTGPLFVVKEKKHLPQFFFKKNKILANKETSLLHKIELKQENFRNLLPSEYLESLLVYSSGHKEISRKQHFQTYLETINKGLKDFYDKKEK